MVNPITEPNNSSSSSPKEEKPEHKVEQAVRETQEKQRPVQSKRHRCWSCRKKLGLLGIECRCGYIFCSIHRYPEEHHCDFDFQSHQRQILEEQNPAVVAEKINKIE